MCVADLPRICTSDKDASCTTFWAGKRGLYILLRHRGLRVDVINEDDVLDGPTIAKYSTLYITDPHVSAAATTAIADWVAAGEPTMDLSALDIRRFGKFQGNRDFLH